MAETYYSIQSWASNWTYSGDSGYVQLCSFKNNQTYKVRVTRVKLWLGTGNGWFTDGQSCYGYGGTLKCWVSFYRNGYNNTFVGYLPNNPSQTTSGGVSVSTVVGNATNLTNGLLYPIPGRCSECEFKIVSEPYNIVVNPGETIYLNISGGTYAYQNGVLCIDKYGVNGVTRQSYIYVEPMPVTISFNSNGGSSVTSISAQPDSRITLPSSTRTGYTLEGWYNSAGNKVGNAGDTYRVPSNATTLTAHWTIIRCTLTYNANSSPDQVVVPEPQTVNYGSYVTVPSTKPVRPSYTFVNWNMNPNGTGKSIAPNDKFKLTSNSTIYAIWNKLNDALTHKRIGSTWDKQSGNTVYVYGNGWNQLHKVHIFADGEWKTP